MFELKINRNTVNICNVNISLVKCKINAFLKTRILHLSFHNVAACLIRRCPFSICIRNHIYLRQRSPRVALCIHIISFNSLLQHSLNMYTLYMYMLNRCIRIEMLHIHIHFIYHGQACPLLGTSSLIFRSLFYKQVTVFMASLQCFFSRFATISTRRAISSNDLFFCSTMCE